jgi:hypothetical protein
VDDLADRAEVLGRAAATVVLRAAMVVAALFVLALRAATVRAALVIRRSLHQGAGAKHQHAKAGNHGFGHFHRVFLRARKQKRDFERGSKSLGLAV